MHSEAQVFYDRIRAKLNRAESLNDIANWISSSTNLNGRPFSFKDHEFQIEIVNDISRDFCVKKCSQVGLSEITVRKLLGMLSILNNVRGILVLPTTRFASKFAKDRIDSVIEQSPTLSDSIIKASDSSEMKRLGGSTLYINGTVGSTAAISVPAEIVITDELDFCDQDNEGKFASRLRHAEGGGYRGRFSTPTVSDYGISKEFDQSTQRYYMVRCEKCNYEQIPDYENDMRVPGYERPMIDFVREDLNNSNYRIKEAFVACQKCGHDLLNSLLNKDLRRWVAKYPDRDKSGYQVSPFDLPKYNTPTSIMLQMAQYKMHSDYYNFVLGKEFNSKDNRVVDAMVEQGMTLDPFGPKSGAKGVVIGIDVGKVCHYKVYATDVDGELHCIFVGKIRMSDGDLRTQIADLINDYEPRRVVIDAMPEFNLVQNLIDDFPNIVFAAYYVDLPKKKQLGFIEIKEEEHSVIINRSRALDSYVGEINAVRIKHPRMTEMTDVRKHFTQMRKVKQYDEDGEEIVKWVKLSGEDHYMHAGLYAYVAHVMDEHEMGYVPGAVPINLHGVDVGGARKREERALARTGNNRYSHFWARR